MERRHKVAFFLLFVVTSILATIIGPADPITGAVNFLGFRCATVMSYALGVRNGERSQADGSQGGQTRKCVSVAISFVVFYTVVFLANVL